MVSSKLFLEGSRLGRLMKGIRAAYDDWGLGWRGSAIPLTFALRCHTDVYGAHTSLEWPLNLVEEVSETEQKLDF